jgi:hypothetical protein
LDRAGLALSQSRSYEAGEEGVDGRRWWWYESETWHRFLRRLGGADSVERRRKQATAAREDGRRAGESKTWGGQEVAVAGVGAAAKN